MASASNEVYQVLVSGPGGADQGVRAVYKPAAGERPLWDFPGAILARHEVAACRVSEALGWGLVPPTVWRDDLPAGPGVLQEWVDGEPSAEVAVLPPDQLTPGWLPVLRGEDERGREVLVAHRDTERMADIAVFDATINNSDRKAGHLLGSAEATMGIDHGVAFHPEWKLRTVLWGFAGRPLADRHVSGLRLLGQGLAAGEIELDGLDSAARTALADRVRDLLDTGTFPRPRPGWPVVPWPLW